MNDAFGKKTYKFINIQELLQNSPNHKIHKIHKKTPVPDSLL